MSSRIHLQTCNFLLDDVLIEVLIFRLDDSCIPRGWSWIYLVFMKSQRRRKDREKYLENGKGVGLLELLLTFLLSAWHLGDAYRVCFLLSPSWTSSWFSSKCFFSLKILLKSCFWLSPSLVFQLHVEIPKCLVYSTFSKILSLKVIPNLEKTNEEGFFYENKICYEWNEILNHKKHKNNFCEVYKICMNL